jgi:hypothetical protein
MHTITSEAKLVDWLFQELKRSQPQYHVDGSFLLALAGLCQGLLWKLSDEPFPRLSSTLTSSRAGVVTSCGGKLIKFARSLAREAILEATEPCSRSRLIRLMLDALDSNGLRIRKAPGATKARVISTRAFAARRNIRVCVWIGAAKRKQPACPLGGPTDFEKLRLCEADERNRVLEQSVAKSGADKQAAETKVAALQAELLRVEATLRRYEQRVADLQSSLLEAQATIQRQQQALFAAPNSRGHPIYRRVGLDEQCPDFVLQAVRHAYVKRFHPDGRPPHQKDQAQEVLKEANAAFDQISELRRRK